MKVLHYKSNFLGSYNTFIGRVINNHKKFTPIGMCINKNKFIDALPVYEKPNKTIEGLINNICFRLNRCLPFYNQTVQLVKPAIIHAHFGFDGYRMIKPAKLNNIPFITSFYGSDVTRLPTEFDWKRRYRLLAQECNAFVAATAHMKRQLIHLGFPESKIMVIPFGLDLDFFSFNSQIKSSKKIMMIGRMVEKKGYYYAIKAIKLLANEQKNIHLDIYGSGELEHSLKQLVADQHIEDKVTFHGYVSINQLSKEYENHQILLAPSVTASDGDEEGLPNTILEAIACGTAVVATDHAAIGEVIKHNITGKLVPERNSKAIVESIKELWADDELTQKIRISARAVICDKFEISEVVKQIENLYSKVIYEYSL